MSDLDKDLWTNDGWRFAGRAGVRKFRVDSARLRMAGKFKSTQHVDNDFLPITAARLFIVSLRLQLREGNIINFTQKWMLRDAETLHNIHREEIISWIFFLHWRQRSWQWHTTRLQTVDILHENAVHKHGSQFIDVNDEDCIRFAIKSSFRLRCRVQWSFTHFMHAKHVCSVYCNKRTCCREGELRESIYFPLFCDDEFSAVLFSLSAWTRFACYSRFTSWWENSRQNCVFSGARNSVNRFPITMKSMPNSRKIVVN